MMTGPEAVHGACWTCRLRHKRCDGIRPTCRTCRTLEITCHSGHDKPHWMENEELQRDMAEKLKREVKQSAKRRRAIALMGNIAKNAANLDMPSVRYSNRTRGLMSPSVEPQKSSGSPSPILGSAKIEAGESAMGLFVAYMDYVFPVLYPFYNPDILDGGRSWILILATRKGSFSNAITSLASYFFSVVPVHPGVEHSSCVNQAWTGLRQQSTKALAEIQDDLTGLREQGLADFSEHGTQILSTIVQLLILEVNINASSGWRMHLDAAVFLFNQLKAHSGSDGTNSDATSSPVSGAQEADPPGSSWRRAGLGASRFYTSVLVYADIIASTVVQQEPRLHEYQDGVLIDRPLERSHDLIIEAVTGCAPELIYLVGDIAALDAWKKREQQQPISALQKFDEELLRRAVNIEDRRKVCLTEFASGKDVEPDHEGRPLDSILDQSSCVFGPHLIPRHRSILLSRVWAVAARLYLLVTVQGWRPREAEFQETVAEGIEILEKLASACWLRCLVWPICVIGCLAIGDQRLRAERLVDFMGALKHLGVVRELNSVLGSVWARDIAEGGAWDVAACLQSLERQSLLL